MRARTAIFSCGLLAVALSGCGPGESDSTATRPPSSPLQPSQAASSSGSTLSLAGYHAQVQATCQEFKQRAAALPRPTTDEEVITFVLDSEDITRGFVAAIKNLRPPADQANRIKSEFVQPLDDQTEASLAIPSAVTAGDAGREQELKASAEAARDRINAYAAANDLPACAQ